MLFWIIPLAVFALSLFVIGGLAAKYWERVVALDVSTDPSRVKKEKKTALFMKRLERMGNDRAKTVGTLVQAVAKTSKGWIKRLYSRAQAMERHYTRLQKEASGDVAGTVEMRTHLKEEAEALMERGSYEGAEQRLIELLSLDAKNSEIYELLGRVYIAMHQFDQARQTFEYAQTLSPTDASIITSLGELLMRDGKTREAVEAFERAVDLKPNNPKYLDFLIDSSILAGDRKRAIKGLKLLKAANPENQKISEFEERVHNMPLA